jgi:2C-methyl-D-erythritol 2,4-cyclodiphosphate synthase
LIRVGYSCQSYAFGFKDVLLGGVTIPKSDAVYNQYSNERKKNVELNLIA